MTSKKKPVPPSCQPLTTSCKWQYTDLSFARGGSSPPLLPSNTHAYLHTKTGNKRFTCMCSKVVYPRCSSPSYEGLTKSKLWIPFIVFTNSNRRFRGNLDIWALRFFFPLWISWEFVSGTSMILYDFLNSDSLTVAPGNRIKQRNGFHFGKWKSGEDIHKTATRPLCNGDTVRALQRVVLKLRFFP